jgi:hypothetical protein
MMEMMLRGMILEVDHFPQRSFARAYEILVENDYPAAGTHGNTNAGRIYDIGGISTTGLGRCRAADRTGAMGDGLRDRIALITERGGYPAEGFGFDLNGFAGAPGPRFGDESGCGSPQSDPITYPFMSYAGDVTFQAPAAGQPRGGFQHRGHDPRGPDPRADRGRPARWRERRGPRAAVPLGRGLCPHVGARRDARGGAAGRAAVSGDPSVAWQDALGPW